MTMRRRLPNRHENETFSFLWLNMRFTATTSRFSDGAVAEIFLTNGKIDSHADVMARDAAVAASPALQRGTPLETLRRALLRDPHSVASGPLGAALDLVAGNRGAASSLPVAPPPAAGKSPKALPDLRRMNIVALDIETNDEGLRDDRGSAWPWRGGHVCGISVAYRVEGDVRAHYLTIRHPGSENLDPAQVYRWLKDLIAPGVRFVTLNGIYDWGWLRTDGGIVVPPAERLEEIVALATLIDESQFSCNLDALCDRYDPPGKDETPLRQAVEAAGFASKNVQEHIWQMPARYVGSYAEADAASTLALFEKLNPILDRERTREAYRLEVALLPTVLERLPPAQAGAPARLRAGPQRSRLLVRRPVRDGGRGGRRETRAPGPQPSPAARQAVHPLRRTDTSARWPRDLRPLCAGTVGMRRHGARAMSARRRAPTLYALAAEEPERAGDDRAKAVTALTHRLLADETLRQALVEPIIRSIAAGLIATVVHHRRGAE
jgi:ribonucleoside-diphosphate reductase alpha chain